ncbi:hypothetical protein GCM10023190_12670 [Enteractinococcus fodinae]|uniref:Uncharacterized protein n=1 Tax=Enteractinococcus fodinae TaxID=684663 RepID=A0ABU2B1K4_9MICC|nr:hypothetical protein [Enteractinococcus fodinae]MDR7346254.1 hypothetical protein [Enteractinococcus fodinae]
METIQHKNVVIGALVAVVAVLSALVIVTSIAQMYALTVGLILAQLVSLSAIGYVHIKSREQQNQLFCARLTVSKS